MIGYVRMFHFLVKRPYPQPNIEIRKPNKELMFTLISVTICSLIFFIRTVSSWPSEGHSNLQTKLVVCKTSKLVKIHENVKVHENVIKTCQNRNITCLYLRRARRAACVRAWARYCRFALFSIWFHQQFRSVFYDF